MAVTTHRELELFLRQHVRSIDDVDILLMLRGQRSRWWAPAEVAGALDLPTSVARAVLGRFEAMSLLRKAQDGRCVLYAWMDPPAEASVRLFGQLALLNTLHRGHLTEALSDRSIERIRQVVGALARPDD